MNGQRIRLFLSFIILLGAVVSCKKTENDIIVYQSLDCAATTLNPTVFRNSGLPQFTTLAVGLINVPAGLTTFSINSTNGNFGPLSFTTTLTDGQTTVAIPLVFDGSSTATSETVVVSAAAYASGYCTAIARISPDTSTAPTTDCRTATTPVAKVVCAAESFLATLTDTQKAAVLIPCSKASGTKWSPLLCGADCRGGLPLSSLTDRQTQAALAVVAAATGTTAGDGYAEAMQIRASADILKTAGGMNDAYSSGNYFIAFAGTPTNTGTWQLQFGGYQLALNTTYSGGVVQGSTPLFAGVEPLRWVTPNGTVNEPLNSEQVAMAAMLGSLSSAQLSEATLSDPVTDILLGPGTDGKFPATKAGVKAGSLSTDQQALVLAALKQWVQDADQNTADRWLTIYKNELPNTYIAYSGNALLTNNGDYVRIDGPGVWIEFVCQSGVVVANQLRYRSVWRDHTRDYGGKFSF